METKYIEGLEYCPVVIEDNFFYVKISVVNLTTSVLYMDYPDKDLCGFYEHSGWIAFVRGGQCYCKHLTTGEIVPFPRSQKAVMFFVEKEVYDYLTKTDWGKESGFYNTLRSMDRGIDAVVVTRYRQ